MDDILKKLQEIEKINPNQISGISYNDFLWLVTTIKILAHKHKILEGVLSEMAVLNGTKKQPELITW